MVGFLKNYSFTVAILATAEAVVKGFEKVFRIPHSASSLFRYLFSTMSKLVPELVPGLVPEWTRNHAQKETILRALEQLKKTSTAYILADRLPTDSLQADRLPATRARLAGDFNEHAPFLWLPTLEAGPFELEAACYEVVRKVGDLNCASCHRRRADAVYPYGMVAWEGLDAAMVITKRRSRGNVDWALPTGTWQRVVGLCIGCAKSHPRTVRVAPDWRHDKRHSGITLYCRLEGDGMALEDLGL